MVPMVALLIAGWLVVQSVMKSGPTITIRFSTGEGIEAGKTKIKFKNVDIGVIKSVELSGDHKTVIASAEMSRNAASMLVDDTRFWVVRPRISGGTVSGIGTLLSGSHVGMDIGSAQKTRSDFVGLESPPVLASGTPGREFVLKSDNLGSLDIGSPVFFRRLQVGQIVSFALDPEGAGMIIHVFINAPYDRYVTDDTRFWHASGVDVTLDTTGVKVNTESLVSVLIGGLAFENPSGATNRLEADAQHQYELFVGRAEAMKQHDAVVDKYVLNFKESVRGLTVGAPIDFRGIVIGEVSAINTHFDPATKEFSIPVEVSIFPERLISRDDSGSAVGAIPSERKEFADYLVKKGLRAQLRTASLLTGQLYIAIDFFPSAPKATVDWSKTTPQLPTVPGNLQGLQESITSLVAKLNKIPFEGIGNDLRKTLNDADTLMNTINTDVAPEAKSTLATARETLTSANRALQSDSPLQQSTAETMRELSRTAASFRALAEYLQRHPEALLRGKTEDK
ncbi:MCE family protein [Burkholderia sp. R-69927]|nr:MCE family protein [Burkholderia sp. R-70006]MBK5064413.1 MCE family protein [Burkholderia sp. R-70199]MBK5090222.1 MCE family protein [Burkholderia sp. R-69927]MBK5122426.1 MCE family protein [Burkholderia sp. R-69980]MBK5168386.1 MCE family protein [Burkholderia sp. R-70211]MBK5183798.1 MCE family protein [Burkholderia sp. R-69749]MCI0149306.1 MCE family protein [Paraburkholderia sediminicola]